MHWMRRVFKFVRDLLLKLKSKGKIIIIACHDKEELELLSDEIYIMENGKIAGHEVLQKAKDINVNSEYINEADNDRRFDYEAEKTI